MHTTVSVLPACITKSIQQIDRFHCISKKGMPVHKLYYFQSLRHAEVCGELNYLSELVTTTMTDCRNEVNLEREITQSSCFGIDADGSNDFTLG